MSAVSLWVKKGARGAALSRMRRRSAKRITGASGDQPAVVIACAELWTYRQARRKGKRQNLWVWTAVVVAPDE